jgi:hypothetical protein
MSRAWSQVISTAFGAVLSLTAAVAVAQPGPPGAAAPPSGSSAPPAEECDPAVAAWAKSASQQSGLAITAAACPTGVVRLQIAGAGCDFEVARGRGFQTTADGKFGVSPIANLDWTTAPEPMKKALAGVLAALTHDPSLPLREGEPVRHPPGEGKVLLGSRTNQILAGSGGGALLVAAGVGAWMMRRRRARPAAAAAPATEPAPAPVEPPPAPPAE